uniref:Rac/Cdc42 guanine nucleotide exchange factor (GEF) 6 n=1 Tax=Esox lucius TaxID=8010 RepID=A0A6Q2WS10_ESOLU
MNPEEQTVTWLISLGVLNSPKKNIADPEEFLKTSLKDGVVLCKLMERLVPGSVTKYCQDPRNEADCIANIKEFLRGCTTLKVEGFEPECLYTGENFNKVLTTLLGVNFATQGNVLPNQEMAENGGAGLVLVKARFQFKQNNEDELSFNKGDLISVFRQEEGGWWEGSLNGKTGWFPSNYVREVKPCDKPVSPKATQLTKNYYSVVVQDILEHEREFVKELQTVLGCYLRPLQASDKLSSSDTSMLTGNLEDILTFQQGLVLALEECTKVPESQQRVAACFLNLIGQIRTLYLSYCSSHPSAVCILTDHSEELGNFMESQGASAPGILTLTTSLSKPFMRLDKYPVLLQELERHVEETHPDHGDILKATAAFKGLVTHCQDLRRRKNLEIQILSEPVRGWDGEGMKSLGQVAYMSQVHMQNGPNEVRFTGVCLCVCVAGGVMDRITVFCSNPQELQDWLDHLHSYTKGASPGGTIIRTISVVGTPGHQSHLPSFSAPGQANRGPLEPLKTPKPWSLSCLRPAPPLKPSAALGYKEDSSKSPGPIKKFLPKRRPERKPSDDEFLLRKSTAALEEDAQILKVIEAYCAGVSMHQANSGEAEDMGGWFFNMFCVLLVSLSLSCGVSHQSSLVPAAGQPNRSQKWILDDASTMNIMNSKQYCLVCLVDCLQHSNPKGFMDEIVIPSFLNCRSLVDAVYALKDEVHELKKENKWMKQCLEEEQKSRKELEKVVRKLAKQKNDCVWEDGGH